METSCRNLKACLRQQWTRRKWSHPESTDVGEPDAINDIPIFTMDELKKATGLLRNRKVPSPIRVTPDALKAVVGTCSELMLEMYNKSMKHSVFSSRCRIISRLVMIRKGNTIKNVPSFHRPLDMYVLHKTILTAHLGSFTRSRLPL